MNLEGPPESPIGVRSALNRLEGQREAQKRRRAAIEAELLAKNEFLEIADEVKASLEHANEQLFQSVIGLIETQLTRGVREVLDQTIDVKCERGERAGQVTLKFHVERLERREDIMRGQGGSVVNVLSVGLRLLALSAADQKAHRRFLILDEQDCWLRPDLVPRLANIVHGAGKLLGFQVLMVSHHDSGIFQRYADRIYRCEPNTDENGPYVDVKLVPDGRPEDATTAQREVSRKRGSANTPCEGMGSLFE